MLELTAISVASPGFIICDLCNASRTCLNRLVICIFSMIMVSLIGYIFVVWGTFLSCESMGDDGSSTMCASGDELTGNGLIGFFGVWNRVSPFVVAATYFSLFGCCFQVNFLTRFGTKYFFKRYCANSKNLTVFVAISNGAVQKIFNL